MHVDNLVSFDLPEVGEKVYRVDRRVPLFQLVAMLLSKHALRGADAAPWTLQTLGGLALHPHTTLAHYGLGTLFKHWMLKVVALPAPAADAAAAPAEEGAVRRVALIRRESASHLTDASTAPVIAPLGSAASVSVLLVFGAALTESGVPPLLRAIVDSTCTASELCSHVRSELALGSSLALTLRTLSSSDTHVEDDCVIASLASSTGGSESAGPRVVLQVNMASRLTVVRQRVACSVRGVAQRVRDDVHAAREELRVSQQRAHAERSALHAERAHLHSRRTLLLLRVHALLALSRVSYCP